MGPPASHRVTRVRCYSGATRPSSDFAYRTVTFFGLSFQTASAIRFLLCEWSATPHRSVVWALPLSLAATQGIDVSFSSSGYLDVSVHRVASGKAMDSLYGACALPHAGFPIRISAGRRLFAPYRSFSQLAASFFGSYCQGIRLMLFVS